jgi:hypothetical protein
LLEILQSLLRNIIDGINKKLMEPITEEELGGVVANMAHEKSLGIDKFTKKCCYKVLQRMLGCYGT